MKLTTRELVTISIFGTLWGVVEITLGSVLKTLDIPMTGMFLAAFGLMIAMIGRIFVPKKGSTLFIGVIAMLLKLFSLGGIIIGPMVGIFAEAFLAEIVLSTKAKPTRWLMALAGAVAELWVVVQPFVTGPLLLGRTLLAVWLDMVDKTTTLFGINLGVVWLAITIFVLIHILVGAIAGLIAWGVGQQIAARTRKGNPGVEPPIE